MIRQDHLVGRPRNMEFISICSIGTIRVGIPSGTTNHETFRWNEGVVIMASGLPMKRSSGTRFWCDNGSESYPWDIPPECWRVWLRLVVCQWYVLRNGESSRRMDLDSNEMIFIPVAETDNVHHIQCQKNPESVCTPLKMWFVDGVFAGFECI